MSTPPVTIVQEKIRLYWRDKYVTEGTDQALSALPPGVYRGGVLKATPTAPDQWFHIKGLTLPWRESFYVVNDAVESRSFVVRETGDIDVEMSSEFPIGGGGAVWYVWVRVAYTTGAATEGYYEVTDTEPGLDHDVIDGDCTTYAGYLYSAAIVGVGGFTTDDVGKRIRINGDERTIIGLASGPSRAQYSGAAITGTGKSVQVLLPHGSFVRIGKITLPGGATTILDSYISMANETDRDVPIPRAVETFAEFLTGDIVYGLQSGEERWRTPTVDQKKAMDAASPAPTASNPFATVADTVNKIFAEPRVLQYSSIGGPSDVFKQMTGTYYVGLGATGTANQFFQVKGRDSLEPLMSTARVPFTVLKVCQSGSATELNPGVDALPNGFYTNPRVYFSAIIPAGNYDMWALRQSTLSGLDEIPAGAFPLAWIQSIVHANQAPAQDETGNPLPLNNWTSKSVGGALKVLLDAVNAKTIDPNSTDDTWYMIWRSNNVQSDGAVTKKTVTVYWNNRRGFMLLRGAYINTAAPTYVVAGLADSPVTDVAMVFVRIPLGQEDVLVARKISPTAGTTWEFVNGDNWDLTSSFSGTDGVRGSAHGLTGRGVVAEGPTGAYPAHAALRVVPQDAQPNTLTEGDVWAVGNKLFAYINGQAQEVALHNSEHAIQKRGILFVDTAATPTLIEGVGFGAVTMVDSKTARIAFNGNFASGNYIVTLGWQLMGPADRIPVINDTNAAYVDISIVDKDGTRLAFGGGVNNVIHIMICGTLA